jgi:hypothetical protein
MQGCITPTMIRRVYQFLSVWSRESGRDKNNDFIYLACLAREFLFIKWEECLYGNFQKRKDLLVPLCIR